MSLHGQGHRLIVWNEAYSTGVSILDEQHRAFAAIINTLHYLLSGRQEEEEEVVLKPVVDLTLCFARVHFKTELDLLKLSDYPRLWDHKAQHDRLLAELSQHDKPEAFLDFLKAWWQKHTLHEDRAYGQHLLDFFKSQQRVIRKR